MSATTDAVALGGIVAGQILEALEGGGQWTLTGLDPQVPFTIRGRFPIRDGVEVDVGAEYAIGRGLGDQGELVQFLAGRSDRVNCTVELHDTTPIVPDLSLAFDPDALTVGIDARRDDVKAELEQIVALVRKHPALRRTPRCRLTVGTEWSRDVYVLAAPYTIKRIDWTTGRLAEVYVRLSMIQAVDGYLEETDPGAPLPESVEVVAGAGWMHELIAAAQLGDPSLGVYLRQRDTDHYAGILTSGSRVLVVDRDHPSMRGPVFLSPVLADDGTGAYLEAYRQHLAARAGARQVPG